MDATDIDTGYDSLLVVACRFSGYTVAIPHCVTDDADELGRLLGRHVFEVFGVPTVLLSDHEWNFESASFSSAMEGMGCRLELGTPYHYRTSGGVEIRVKALQDALNQRCHRTKGQHWVAELSKALYSVNKVENPRTKLSPFSIMYTVVSTDMARMSLGGTPNRYKNYSFTCNLHVHAKEHMHATAQMNIRDSKLQSICYIC
jgi:hypothetical protein